MAGRGMFMETAWEGQQVQSLHDLRMQLAELTEQNLALRNVVERLLHELLEEGIIESPDEDTWLTDFLGGTRHGDVHRQAAMAANVVVAKLRCPKCDGVVNDIKGVYDEKCMWCGYQFTTTR